MPHLSSDERYAAQALPTIEPSDQMLMLGMTVYVFAGAWVSAHYWLLCISLGLVFGKGLHQLAVLTGIGAIIGGIGLITAAAYHRRDSIMPFLGLLGSSALLGIYAGFTTLF